MKTMARTGIPYADYENPDSRCHYPFQAEAAGYCYSFASHVSGDLGFEDMTAICSGGDCEYWGDKLQERAGT